MHAAPSASRPRRRPRAALRFGRAAASGAVLALVLIAGVWASWSSAPYVMLTKGRERGTMVVTRCAGGACSGPYRPRSPGSAARPEVMLARAATVRQGRSYDVVVKPGTDEVLRSGPAGVLYAWAPLGGALLLASVLAAGGLRLTRTAWLMAGAGTALLTAAFLAQ
ncbi:hypothetical protein [Streptomyces sp. NPDC046985]|uniref:hypothetical protein n=1 Tax=Streptomyces sp. NPDC046985 TaxID=3155377 RepID=UPI0033C9F02D